MDNMRRGEFPSDPSSARAMRAVIQTRRRCLHLFAITIACLGCARGESEDAFHRTVAVETNESQAATKPTGSQELHSPVEAGSVRLYFHPDGDGWQVYDEAVRDRDYWEGALTQEERAKREAALASLPTGVFIEYVDARVTKLSDNPQHIPPDDATDEVIR